MAENKKSFVLYSDLMNTVAKLPDDKAGLLFKTILEYVNDKNPEVDDLLVDVVFEPIKQQLKRDLAKYEDKRKQWSEAGKRSAEARRLKKEEQKATKVNDRSTTVKTVPTKPTVNVNANANVSVNVNANKSMDERKRSFLTITQKTFSGYLGKGGNDLAIKQECTKFFEYWTESNLNGKKMRFEKEKTFDIGRRVSRWMDNTKQFKKSSQSNANSQERKTAIDFAKEFD
jgi:hypothetical protein